MTWFAQRFVFFFLGRAKLHWLNIREEDGPIVFPIHLYKFR